MTARSSLESVASRESHLVPQLSFPVPYQKPLASRDARLVPRQSAQCLYPIIHARYPLAVAAWDGGARLLIAWLFLSCACVSAFLSLLLVHAPTLAPPIRPNW